MVAKLCCVCVRDEAVECSANRHDLSCIHLGPMSMEESLQFLLNYAVIWVWHSLILLYGQSGFCCCRSVCFQLTFFCPHSDPFLDMLLFNVFLISPFNLLIYCIFIGFYSFPFFGNVFSISPQSCHKCPIYFSSFPSNLKLVKAY
jgi:hypothetical protein